MAGLIIRTVCGDIAPGDLGVCYGHEHVLGRPPDSALTPDLDFTDEAAAIAELGWFHTAGGRSLVEMTTPDYGRSAAGLARVSAATDVHIIAATGYNHEKYSAPFIAERSIDALAAHYVREVEVGMDGTTMRAGVIKAASPRGVISPLAEKMLRAAARAACSTGAPISTHTEAGTMALEQVAILREEGADLRQVIIGHMDRNLDLDLHLALAETGVTLGYDQISKEKHYPDRQRIEFILKLVEAGFGGQIVLGGDFVKRSYWPAYGTGGGPGLTYILWRFIPWLRQSGLSEAAITALLIDNPARALAFTPSR